MEILKLQNNNIALADSGDWFVSFPPTAKVEILDDSDIIQVFQSGFVVYQIDYNEVTETQVLPNAAIPFNPAVQKISELLQILATDFFKTPTTAGGGGGEANTASNVGFGNGIFKQKSGVDLQFKSLVAGVGLNIVPSLDELTISSTGFGDMLKSVYDPTNIAADCFDKANETGIEQITGSIITPPVLTGTANNYNPTGFATANMIRQDVNANNRQITGFIAPPLGVNRIIYINNINTSSDDIRFLNNSILSNAQNRILLRDNGSRSLRPNQTAVFWYDHTSQRWKTLNRMS